MLYVPVSAFAGDKGAVKRVASGLRAHVEDSADKSDELLFWGVRDKLNADELARLERECKKEARSR